MEANLRQDLDNLIEELSKDGSSYSVFYAIHMYETLLNKVRSNRRSDMLDQKGFKFRPYEQYLHQQRNLHHVERKEDALEFVITFLGLYGNDSPLPRSYHNQVSLQQSYHGEGSVPLQGFLDIFNNRFYWLYYKAWKKYRYYLRLDSSDTGNVREQLFAFTGQGPEAHKEKLPIPEHKLLSLSGIMSNRARSKQGLMVVLQEVFPAFKMHVREFVRSMVRIDERPYMGNSTGKQRMRLGRNCIIGQWVADYTSRICVVIGPLDFDSFLNFLPDGRLAPVLRYVMKHYLNDSLKYDVKLVVWSDGIKKMSWRDKRVRLGRSCWLGKPREDKVERYITNEEYILS